MSNTILVAARAAVAAGSTLITDDLAMKQLVHTQLLYAMDESGLLDVATFQGGSSISNCYGGIRLSEDLDFVVDEFPSASESQSFADIAIARLADLYGAAATVKTPQEAREGDDKATVPVERFQVALPIVDGRPDIPQLCVKIELARVSKMTNIPMEAHPPILDPTSSGPRPIVLAEEPVELVADKVISFSSRCQWTRHRDLWDINWLAACQSIDLSKLRTLVTDKIEDYGLNRSLLVDHVAELRDTLYRATRSREALSSVADTLFDVEYAKQARSARGAMAIVGKALGIIESALLEG